MQMLRGFGVSSASPAEPVHNELISLTSVFMALGFWFSSDAFVTCIHAGTSMTS